MKDTELARLLSRLEPKRREVLRRAMRADQFERDEFAETLLRQRTGLSRDLAELLDSATLHVDLRQQFVRVLGHMEARS